MSSYDSPQGSQPTTPRFRVGDALIVSGGAFVFLFSFLPFVSYSDELRGPIERSGFGIWFNAWQAQTFMAPLTWFVILAAVTAGGLSVANYVLKQPITLLKFSAPQLQVITSVFAFVTLLGYATSAKSVVFGSNYAQYLGGKAFTNGIDFGVGGYLMLVFALLCSVGTLMNLYDIGPTLFSRSSKATAAPTVSQR